VAEYTPVQLHAAQLTETQARARYQAGLGTIVEVADAQRLLVDADIEDALARLSVWRSLLHMAVAQGDLQPLLQLVQAKSQGGP
jgi:outer membrane protein